MSVDKDRRTIEEVGLHGGVGGAVSRDDDILGQPDVETGGDDGVGSNSKEVFMKEPKKNESKKLTTNAGAPVVDNQNTMTAGPRGPGLLQDVWFLAKLAPLDREG